MSRNPSHAQYKKIPWCKTCLDNMYLEFVKRYGDAQYAMYYLCRKIDVGYSNNTWQGAKKSVEQKNGTILGAYMKIHNSFMASNGLAVCFEDSPDMLEDVGEVKKNKRVTRTQEDKKSQDDVLRLLGYDPFADYDGEDRKYLYNNLIGFLDEDTLEDGHKISIVLQLADGNNQIRKLGTAINQLSSGEPENLIKNAKTIHELTLTRNNLIAANNTIAKENQIALKHRAGAGTQNNTLGSMMKKLREMNFEKAEHDYYDMKKAFGIRQSADISNKSIVEILNLSDDNNINNMLKMQREELQKLQDAELDYKEQIRVLVTELNDVKNKTVESGG